MTIEMTIELAGILAQVLPVFALAAIVEIRSLVASQRDFQKEVTTAASSATETGAAARAVLERLVTRIVRDRAKDAQLVYLSVLSIGVVALGGQEVVALLKLSGSGSLPDALRASNPILTAVAIVAVLCLAPGIQGLNSAGQQARFRWKTRRTHELADRTLDITDSSWISLAAVGTAVAAFLVAVNL